jgi:hypothetical protein
MADRRVELTTQTAACRQELFLAMSFSFSTATGTPRSGHDVVGLRRPSVSAISTLPVEMVLEGNVSGRQAPSATFRGYCLHFLDSVAGFFLEPLTVPLPRALGAPSAIVDDVGWFRRPLMTALSTLPIKMMLESTVRRRQALAAALESNCLHFLDRVPSTSADRNCMQTASTFRTPRPAPDAIW